VRCHCYKLSLSKHTGGGDTAPAFSGLHVYLQLTWEVGLPLLSCGVFLPPPLLQAFLLLVATALSGQARLVYLQFREGFSPVFGAQGAPPSLLRVFIVLIAYYLVSLFSPGGGQSIQGAMLIWPRDVCGSTTYNLAHLVVHIFPSRLDPPSFSIQWK
jgi:hypothetical protein